MNNFNQTQSNSIHILYDGCIKAVDRAKLYAFLLKHVGSIFNNKNYTNRTLNAVYANVYDFILYHLHDIDNIQIYKDNAIVLYSKERCSEQITFEDVNFCKADSTEIKIQLLLEFINI